MRLLRNLVWVAIGYVLILIFNLAFALAISLPGLMIGFNLPHLICSSLFLYLTFLNLYTLDYKKTLSSKLCLITLLLLLIFYSMATWYSFSIKEGKKQGFNSWSNLTYEYSNKYWYFLNRIHPLFPFIRNGSAYIDKDYKLSIPSGYISLAKNQKRIGWHLIVSDKFYYFSFFAAFIYGLNISALITRKLDL